MDGPHGSSAAATRTAYSIDAIRHDPPLLRENSELKTFTTSRFEYPNLRIFHRPHAKFRELTEIQLPLLVCIPGLGGSVAQFHPLLTSLVDFAPCLAIDYPGGGCSDYAIAEWGAYTSEALLELLEVVIEHYRDQSAEQSVVLIGHSMGTTLAAGLASRELPHATTLTDHIVGVIAICPLSGSWSRSVCINLRRLTYIPGWLFSLWRAWDSIGGSESRSVIRNVGRDADPELKLLQYRFNKQSRTPVFRRMLWGALPYFVGDKSVGGIPGLDVWASLRVPVYLIAGERDKLTPPSELGKIARALCPEAPALEVDGQPRVEMTRTASRRQEDGVRHSKDSRPSNASHVDVHIINANAAERTPPGTIESLALIPPQPRRPAAVVRASVMRAPANHALLYMPSSVRALAGLVSDFLATCVTGRLSLAWQLQHLSHEGKWDVKNLIKWKSITPVSDAIGPVGAPVFRAMKTLREVDDVHCPRAFVDRWGTVIKDVIDISKDQPVYDPHGLERAGVGYHKFPTVSKVPPEAHEVEAFVRLVDRLRAAQEERATAEESASAVVIGVHCHYGFNRTGYFVVCYLVESCHFTLPEAIEAFTKARPNGIRHSHFLDRLYVRYNVKCGPLRGLSHTRPLFT